MLKVGDKVLHYVDDLEGYRTFQIVSVDESNRCQLKGVDTTTILNRVLRNDVNSKVFNYFKVEG